MKSSEIRQVRSGYGLLVLSTPKGIMTGSDARKAGLGGEALFTAW
jgi:small subunit ribosomal protein S8